MDCNSIYVGVISEGGIISQVMIEENDLDKLIARMKENCPKSCFIPDEDDMRIFQGGEEIYTFQEYDS